MARGVHKELIERCERAGGDNVRRKGLQRLDSRVMDRDVDLSGAGRLDKKCMLSRVRFHEVRIGHAENSGDNARKSRAAPKIDPPFGEGRRETN